MKLEGLKPNFTPMSQEEQLIFFTKYIERRSTDLAKVVTTKKTRKASGKKVVVTQETLDILSKLKLV